MRLEEQDITIIKQLLEDYQEYCGRSPWDGFEGIVSASHPANQNWIARSNLYGRLTRDTPLVLKSLSDELPSDFCMLKTSCEWFACHLKPSQEFSSWVNPSLVDLTDRLIGPTTEFQARLWCWQESLLEKDITETKEL